MIKAAIISILVIGLMIPTFLIVELVQERKTLLEEVKQEVSAKWSGEQTIEGPLLLIPYLESLTSPDGQQTITKKLCYILPDALDISGSVSPEIRYRSIYKIAVYNADLQVRGSFAEMPFDKLGLEPGQLMLHEAQLVMGLSDFRGISDQIPLDWDDAKHEMNPGIIPNDVISNGLGAPIQIDSASHAYSFSFPLRIKGSQTLRFVPTGKTTTVNLSSAWPDPNFSGSFLPTERTVDKNGFTARWNVLHLNRNFPQFWKDQYYTLSDSAFGVSLLDPVDSYAQTIRTVKYAILVILLTFTVYFFVEVFQKKNVHPIQYVLVGFALCIFYLLVLSISEYLPFVYAYLIAAAATVSIITVYTSGVFRSVRTGISFGAFLGLLHIFIYVLIRMQEGALLFGSIGLFVILSAIMYLSRKFDWYGQQPKTA